MARKTHVIDGVTYVEVDRKAKVGDIVLVISSGDKFYKKGDIAEVVHVYGDVVCADFRKNADYYGDGHWALSDTNFLVLDKRGDCYEEETTVDTSQASEQVIEMFAALSRKIVSLERQLADTQRNVERQAEELENAKFGITSLTCDVITLDERSQVLNAINKYYAEGSR